MNIRRLIGGLSFLFFLVGALLVCFIPGGFLNPHPFLLSWMEGVSLNQPWHIVGFVFLGVGAVGFVVLYSLEKK
ncbi:MAG: hypothetical protein L0Z62_05420 [Gemmataceae bacterium]|nr:hypothetical protein [Gemmataceae bacterium]